MSKTIKKGIYKVEIEFELKEDTPETVLDKLFIDAMYDNFDKISDSDIGKYIKVNNRTNEDDINSLDLIVVLSKALDKAKINGYRVFFDVCDACRGNYVKEFDLANWEISSDNDYEEWSSNKKYPPAITDFLEYPNLDRDDFTNLIISDGNTDYSVLYYELGTELINEENLKSFMNNQRLVTLTDGTGMGGTLYVFSTNAPEKELKELEKISQEAYVNDEDVPIWSSVLCEKGFVFDYVDEHGHITPYDTSSDWLERKYPYIKEHYVIG